MWANIATVGNAAAGAASFPGATAAAAAAPVYTWEDIRAYCRKHQQDNTLNNFALKYFRYSFEDHPGVSKNAMLGTDFDLREDTLPIYVAHHEEKGPKYWFDGTCEQQP